jgi:hypothetical protein
MSSSINVWQQVIDELYERKEEGVLELRKDLFSMFYKEHGDIEKACRLADVATAWLAKKPNLDDYPTVGE